jgi:hypothetical protein
VKYVPVQYVEHERAPDVVRWLYKDRILETYESEMRRFLLSLILSLAMELIIFPAIISIPLALYSINRYFAATKDLYEVVEEELFQKLRDINMEISPMLKTYRDKYASIICKTSIGLAALYGLARAYRAYKENIHGVQGSLEPETEVEVMERDQAINPWTGVVKRELPIAETSKRMSTDHVDNIVKKALLYGTIHTDDGNGMVNGLMLSSNVILIPNHYFTEFGDELKCTFRKKNPEASGGKFVACLHINYSHLIPNSDLRVCYVPNGGSFKNLVNNFPTGDMPSVPFRLHWRKKDGDLITAKGMTSPGIVRTIHSFNGGMYKNLTINTFDGLCGATLVSETNGSVILGVHLGGTAGTPVGVYGSITQQQLFAAFEDLRSKEGVVLSGEAGKFEAKVLGVQIMKPDSLHKKSALNYLPKNSQIEYFGSCLGRAVTKSDVKVTPISTHITDVCGVPNIYRGPKLNPDWYGWQAPWLTWPFRRIHIHVIYLS